jgi:hypothetical protein
MSALIHLSERGSIFGISTLRYSRAPPTSSHTLNDTRTLNCSSRDGHRGSVDRAIETHRTNGVLSSTTRGVVTTKQTSQVTLTPGRLLQPKLKGVPRDTGFPPVQPKESQSVFTFLLLGRRRVDRKGAMWKGECRKKEIKKEVKR